MNEITIRLNEISENDSSILVNNSHSDSSILELDLMADTQSLNDYVTEEISINLPTFTNNETNESSNFPDVGISSEEAESNSKTETELEEPIDLDGKTNNVSIDLVSHHEEDEIAEEAAVVNYPFIELQGVTTMQELEFLAHNQKRTEMSIDLQIRFGDVMKHLGFINFDLDTMQALRFIGGYKLTLHKNENSSIQINLDNPDTFIKLIRL